MLHKLLSYANFSQFCLAYLTFPNSFLTIWCLYIYIFFHMFEDIAWKLRFFRLASIGICLSDMA